MLPLIFVSDDTDKQNNFIQTVIETEKYIPYYIYRIVPLKTEFGIDQIRAIKKEIITAIPHKRLFAISLFDTASLEAQNAFLKTLEEKNDHNQFILLVTDIGRVLPTILSRSKVVFPEGRKVIKNLNSSVEEILNIIVQKKEFSFLQSTSSMNREDSIKLFDHIILILQSRLKGGSLVTVRLLKKALQQKSFLVENNLNPQLTVDSFLLFYRKQLLLIK